MKVFSLIALVLVATPVSAFAAPDTAFLSDALKADNNEVAVGKLAESRASTPAARSYAQMLVTDHTAHRQKIIALGVAPTMALSPDGMQMRSMLMGLHGTAFDAAFKQGMIDDHQKVIAKYQGEANSAESPAVKQLVQETLPVLNQHLAGAQAL